MISVIVHDSESVLFRARRRAGPTASEMTSSRTNISQRPVNTDMLELARQRTAGANTATELREALAVLLPGELGLTLQETAQLLGRSHSWVANARHRFTQGLDRAPAQKAHGGRRNQIMPAEEEAAFMDEVCRVYIKIRRDWRRGNTRGPKAYAALQVRFEEHVRLAVEQRAGRPVSRATAYNLMARVGRQRFQDYEAWQWRLFCERSF